MTKPAKRWIAVSRKAPCPVCGKPDNCKLSHDGSAVWCGRVSDGSRRQNAGGQWLHRVNGHDEASQATDWEDEARALALQAGMQRRELADALGVSPESLKALGVGWNSEDQCWTFPERDADGAVIGLSRRFSDGSKRQATGSKRGLCYADGWQETGGPVLIVEGGSDTAAGITLGLPTIGRPSNRGGADHLVKLLANQPADREIIVLGERDEKPDGQWPGRDGAVSVAGRLAAGLGRSVGWALPPAGAKDLRAWLQANGPDADSLLAGLDVQKCSHPEPVDTAPAWEPFPCKLLPDPIGRYVNEVASALCCDESYVGLPMLAALAGAVGNTRRLRINPDWCEPAVVWAVPVGESGNLKSPAFDKATEPLQQRQSAAFAEYERELERYEQAKLVYEAELDEWKRNKKDGLPPVEPVAPLPARWVCSDTTIEAIALLLTEHRRGLLLARDELSGWLRSFDAYRSGRGGDVGHWLSMHRAGPVTMDRKTGRRVIHVPRAAVSITGTIQPDILRLVLGSEHFADGLAARLLLAMPPARPKRYTESQVSEEMKTSIQDVFDRLLSLDFDTDEDGDPQPRDVPLTPDAKQVWAAFVNDFGSERYELTGDLAAAFSKLEAYAGRLALIVHLVRAVSDDGTTDPDSVERQSVEDGIKLARWFAGETRRIYARIAESEQQAEHRELRELIQRKGGRLTPRELAQASREHRPTDVAEAALNDLAKAGWGDWQTVETGGRPRREFVLFSPSTSTKAP